MIEGFKHLTKEEFAQLKNAVPMIAALIGGADGDFDNKERKWAEKIVGIYGFAKGDPLDKFFDKVADHFSDKASSYFSHHPDLEERNAYLTAELAKLNDILPKLDPDMAFNYYKALLHFAKEISKASGGIFGFLSTGPEEAKLAKLSMINPLEKPTA